MFHRNSTLNHKIENWTYADAAAREAATGFVSGDLNKIAYQTDTGVYYRLSVTTPVWVAIAAVPRYLVSPAIPAGTAVDIDCATGDTFQERTLTATTAFTLINLSDGQCVVVPIKNTASDYAATWVGVDEWKGTGGVEPTLSLGAKTDLFTFVKCGSKTFGTYAAHE